jgi:mannose-6-phosphate isomerase-like protein (cupin superfamily)
MREVLLTAHMRFAAFAAAAAVAIALSSTAGTASAPLSAEQSAATAKPGSLGLTVLDESGAPVVGAIVALRGAVERQGVTGPTGVATLLNIPTGTHRVRITREGFITLEKEVSIKGTRLTTDTVLSPAPAPPPPPPAPKPDPKPTPPPSSTATGPVGQSKTLSILDLAEQMLNDKAPIVEREIGCSVATASRLILVRETLASHSHSDADEMIYLVAGDASIRIFDKDTPISPGWFALVPRGTSHSISKRGRNAPILLSIRSGQTCGT